MVQRYLSCRKNTNSNPFNLLLNPPKVLFGCGLYRFLSKFAYTYTKEDEKNSTYVFILDRVSFYNSSDSYESGLLFL